MFKAPDNYFCNITCPRVRNDESCEVINCLFNHDKKRPLSDDDSNIPTESKRQNIQKVPEPSITTEDDIPVLVPIPITHISIPRAERVNNATEIAKSIKSNTPNKDAIKKEYELAGQAMTLEDYRELIAEYGPDLPELKDPQYVLPKELHSPPATIQVRKSNILEFVKAYQQMQPSLRTPKLKAIEEEYRIAQKTTKLTYMHTIKRKIYEIRNPAKIKRSKELSDDELYEELSRIVIGPDKLQKYGYVTEVPTPIEPAQTRTCSRCKHEFKLADQLTPIHCAFHAGKPTKKDRKRVYTCCGAEVGDNESDACTSYMHHVFTWDSPGEKQSFLPYRTTTQLFPANPNAFKALGIDCEMGFTTKGFELLRITAMDFFTGDEVLDVLVKPIGQVIDLNTRWSGIAEIKQDALSFGQLIRTLGEIMDCNTILIGHGLENDLNSMRLIHNRVVDTAILYPKLKTSPTFRYPLKYLTFKYLGKTIQTGEHDSGEDALAAIDVVKFFIKKDLQ